MRRNERDRAMEGYDRLELLSGYGDEEVTLEELRANFRFINYRGGEYAHILQEGIKLSTVRTPEAKYLEIEAGEVVMGYSVEEDLPIPMVHIGTIRDLLWRMPPALLALDGFWSMEELEMGMKRHYPDVTLDSDMICMVQIPLSQFLGLNRKQQGKLFETDPRELMAEKTLRSIFWRALGEWYLDMARRRQDTEPSIAKNIAEIWVWQLNRLGLITERQRIHMEHYQANLRRQRAIVEIDSLEKFERVLRGDYEGKVGIYHRKMILGLSTPVSVHDRAVELPPCWN